MFFTPYYLRKQKNLQQPKNLNSYMSDSLSLNPISENKILK